MKTSLPRMPLALSALALAACSASGADDNSAAASGTRILEAPELMVHVVEPAARSF